MDRDKRIIKVSVYGIVVNIILVAFKMIVGFIASSIAIVLDAVNNLSDALSSIITIIGTKLSNKRPNKKHPYGYGRVEYFSSIIIAIIVFLAGVAALRESVDRIINPTTSNYSIYSLVIIFVAVLVKYFFGNFVKNEGKKLNSSSLVASGSDAIGDSLLSLTTLVGALISYIFGINLEGYLGLLIGIMILKTSIEILKDTINDMIGIRADSEDIGKLKKIINSYEQVLGVYDLTIHNYGPNKMISSAHIQLDDNLNVRDVHRLTRRIEIDVYMKTGIILTLGIYASNDLKEYKDIKKYLNDLISNNKNIIQMHGFYVDEDIKLISFDLIFNFDEEHPEIVANDIREKLSKKFPEYNYSVILDADISD